MAATSLSGALEREHRDIDGGIEEFIATLDGGEREGEPLLRALGGLRRHIYLEERFLFPPLREAGLTMPIFVMMREHGELWDAMDAVEALLEAGSEQELLDTCRGLLALLDNHNSKEEPIIYPHADSDLDEWTSGQLDDFLAEGRMPDGWVCEKATR